MTADKTWAIVLHVKGRRLSSRLVSINARNTTLHRGGARGCTVPLPSVSMKNCALDLEQKPTPVPHPEQGNNRARNPRRTRRFCCFAVVPFRLPRGVASPPTPLHSTRTSLASFQLRFWLPSSPYSAFPFDPRRRWPPAPGSRAKAIGMELSTGYWFISLACYC